MVLSSRTDPPPQVSTKLRLLEQRAYPRAACARRAYPARPPCVSRAPAVRIPRACRAHRAPAGACRGLPGACRACRGLPDRWPPR